MQKQEYLCKLIDFIKLKCILNLDIQQFNTF